MKGPRNLVVAQSGGPTHVINSSLRGVIEAARDWGQIGAVYGARHGIEGVLKEDLLDLSAQSAEEVALLRYTPVAGSVGTCRYKLKSKQHADFDRVIDVFRAHNVGYFLYNGGNDSMDTAEKIAQLAREKGLDLVAVGIPKTIDNDVGDSLLAKNTLIDHTPGYGSVAKYWLHAVEGANQENAGSCPADPVLVMQAMGRKIGFIPAAARLADPNREMPLLIYLAESGVGPEQLADQVSDQLRRSGRCLVVVSEGYDVSSLPEMKILELPEVKELLKTVKDDFGHVSYGSGLLSVAAVLVNYLNRVGLPTKGAARGNVAGTDQRHSMAYASSVDLDEAYAVGQKAVELAARGEGGYMATILRNPGPIYSVYYDKVPLEDVANSERSFPAEWIAQSGCDVTDDFVRYARPLVGDDMISLPVIDGRRRMTRFEPIYADKKLSEYVPEVERK